jgi:hypothetical protein
VRKVTGTILAALAVTMFAAPLAASVPCVTNLNDSGTGSLRYCIITVDPGSSITFDPSLNGGTITLGSTLTISEPMTIAGPGANLLTISGGNAVEIFKITLGTVNISGLTIANGNSGAGGGIYNTDTLTVTNSTFSGNTASSNGGGIDNDGTLTVTNSTFFGNTANIGGGLFINLGNQTVTNSTFSGNTANLGGGGIFDNMGPLSMSNSIVAGNTTTNNPGDDCDSCGPQSSPNLIGGNPQLSALGWYGGSTQTMLPLPRSPAIGLGLASDTDKPNMDQRGFGRPSTPGNAVDVGAVQTNYLIVTTTTDVSDRHARLHKRHR